MGIRAFYRAAPALACVRRVAGARLAHRVLGRLLRRGLAGVLRPADRRRRHVPAAHARVQRLRVADRRADGAPAPELRLDVPAQRDPRPAGARRVVRRAHGSRERAHALLALVLCAGSPVAFMALDAGHPEDVLAAAAAVAGVLAAVRQKATLSATLLTVAVLAKQTAVLALLPAALALPRPKVRGSWRRSPPRCSSTAGCSSPARAARRPRRPGGRPRRLVLSSLAGRGGRSASRPTPRGRRRATDRPPRPPG